MLFLLFIALFSCGFFLGGVPYSLVKLLQSPESCLEQRWAGWVSPAWGFAAELRGNGVSKENGKGNPSS